MKRNGVVGTVDLNHKRIDNRQGQRQGQGKLGPLAHFR
ncbi:hypothetical protein [Desulfovibrio sp. JC022]